MKETFRFSACVDFSIDEDTAAALLVEGTEGNKAVALWLSNNLPAIEEPCGVNARALKEALGHHLAKKKVDKVRQLTMSCDPVT